VGPAGIEPATRGLKKVPPERPADLHPKPGHLFKHPRLGVDDISDVWANDPLLYPAKPPATG